MTEETFSLKLNVLATPPQSSVKNKMLLHDCMHYGTIFFPCPVTLAMISLVTECADMSVLPVLFIQRSY